MRKMLVEAATSISIENHRRRIDSLGTLAVEYSDKSGTFSSSIVAFSRHDKSGGEEGRGTSSCTRGDAEGMDFSERCRRCSVRRPAGLLLREVDLTTS
jgi:hypothetical protein